ncbi:MAG TPA: universal stress protein, partial [Chitinophagaceae bacterium]|nr:universal stress protein [Chitinophagaceae bacterium]
MNKIVAAFDGLKYAADTAQYAIELTRHTRSFLTGVFLDDFTYSSFKIYDLIQKNELSEKDLDEYRQKDQQARDKAADKFETACRTAGIQYNVHRDKNICLRDLLHESIYADLLVIDVKETFTHYDEKPPTRFVRDLLSDVQCPVLVVNKPWTPIERIVFLYDGAPSSVHAVKTFSYLFPEMVAQPCAVLSAKGYYRDLHLPDNNLMKEFMKRHYPKAAY